MAAIVTITLNTALITADTAIRTEQFFEDATLLAIKDLGLDASKVTTKVTNTPSNPEQHTLTIDTGT